MSTIPGATTLTASTMTLATVFPCLKAGAKNEAPLEAIAPLIVPANVIYASRISGVALDCNLTTGAKIGGGTATDNTTALQTALNTASATLPLMLVMDGPTITTGLNIKSYTTIHSLEGAGFYLKSGSNRELLRNTNQSASTRTDTRIALIGGYFNCNGDGQVGQHDDEGFKVLADHTPMSGIAFYGVTLITLQRIHVYNAACWNVCISNASDILVEHCRFEASAINANLTKDGIDLRGPCERGTIQGNYIVSGDDAIALNTKNYGSSIVGPYIPGGAITGITIKDNYADTLLGVDLISDVYTIDDITISGMRGSTWNYAVWLNVDSAVNGTGNFGTITINDVNMTQTGIRIGGGVPGALIQSDGISKSLTIDGVQFSGPPPFVATFKATRRIDLLTFSGYRARHEAGSGVPTVGDDMSGSPIYVETGGGWTTITSVGYAGGFRYCLSGSGSNAVTWTFANVPTNVGTFDVYATWVEFAGRATNAPYKVYDNVTLWASVAIDQTAAPTADLTLGGRPFKKIFSAVTVSSGTLKVTLTDNANGVVIADAIAYVATTPPSDDALTVMELTGDVGELVIRKCDVYRAAGATKSGTFISLGAGTDIGLLKVTDVSANRMTTFLTAANGGSLETLALTGVQFRDPDGGGDFVEINGPVPECYFSAVNPGGLTLLTGSSAGSVTVKEGDAFP